MLGLSPSISSHTSVSLAIPIPQRSTVPAARGRRVRVLLPRLRPEQPSGAECRGAHSRQRRLVWVSFRVGFRRWDEVKTRSTRNRGIKESKTTLERCGLDVLFLSPGLLSFCAWGELLVKVPRRIPLIVVRAGTANMRIPLSYTSHLPSIHMQNWRI